MEKIGVSLIVRSVTLNKRRRNYDIPDGFQKLRLRYKE